VRYYYIPVRMVKIQNTDNQLLARMWRIRNSQSWLVGKQNGTATLEDSLAVSYKSRHSLTSDPATVLLGIYPNELNNNSSNSREKQSEDERILISQLSALGPTCIGKEGKENYIHTPVRT